MGRDNGALASPRRGPLALHLIAAGAPSGHGPVVLVLEYTLTAVRFWIASLKETLDPLQRPIDCDRVCDPINVVFQQPGDFSTSQPKKQRDPVECFESMSLYHVE